MTQELLWRVILGPCPLSDEAAQAVETALRRGQQNGSIFKFSISRALRGPRAVAREIADALDAGERVLLANGPWQQGPTLGDPEIARAIARLPDHLPPGIVVGGFHHAHALTELALRWPGVETYVAPPLAESLTGENAEDLARESFRVMTLFGESPVRLSQQPPRRSHVGYCRQASRTRLPTLPDPREIVPRVLREGEAQGPILAGNLLPLSFALGGWRESLDGAILAIEIAGMQMRMLDRYVQRLALLGIFDRIGALLVGVPFDLVAEAPALQLDEIIMRAVGSVSCVTVADAFVGCGVPGTHLKLTASTTVRAYPEGVVITQNPSHVLASSANQP